jgi:L-aspartate oxidase
LAQGGVAIARGDGDFDEFRDDTLRAGANLNSKKAVEILVKNSPAAFEFLKKNGVRFCEKPHREAAHSTARVEHFFDKTGAEIFTKLLKSARGNSRISIFEKFAAVEILKKNNAAVGARILNLKNFTIENFFARATILATGGGGALFAKTTNFKNANFDAIFLAKSCGAEISNLEFVQFHPTALNLPRKSARLFLLSEALRGAGAELLNEKNERFVDELKSRDFVSRAIFAQKNAFLNLSKISNFEKKFPQISEILRRENLNFREKIPVSPAAHFSCGGVSTDVFGRTNLQNLFAVGECANAKIHGANRLASNSLLECVVFAARIFEKISSENLPKIKKVNPGDISGVNENKKFLRKNSARDFLEIQKIREKMWNFCGVVREKNSLKKFLTEISKIKMRGFFARKFQIVATEVLKSAAGNLGSVGAHFWRG